MTEPVYVLDASAVLAAFFDEPGADVVAERMDGALLCSVNYSEVVAKLVDRGTPAEQIVEIMEQLDVEVVPADRELAMRAGLLRAETLRSLEQVLDKVKATFAKYADLPGMSVDDFLAKLQMKVTIAAGAT